MTLSLPGTGSDTGTPVIDTPKTPFTSGAGFSAATVAIVSAVIAALQALDVLEVTEPVKIALLALVGVGILAWAISAAGDSFARAYALAHVTRFEGKPNQPAIQTAAFRLADAYAAAHGLKPTTPANTTDSGSSAATTSVYVPSSTAASKEYCLELSPPLNVQVRGKPAQATAVLISGESGKETQRYLVGLPGSILTWMNSDAISMPDAVSPAASAVQSPSTTASQSPTTRPTRRLSYPECCLEFSPPLKVTWQGKDGEAIAFRIKDEGGKDEQQYLVGTQGKPYVWVDEDEVTMR